MGALPLQEHDRHLRRHDPGDCARPGCHDLHPVLHPRHRRGVPDADPAGAPAQRGAQARLQRRAVGRSDPRGGALVARQGHCRQAQGQPQRGDRRGRRPGRWPADLEALPTADLRRRGDARPRHFAARRSPTAGSSPTTWAPTARRANGTSARATASATPTA
jgi:hypothetical protein